MRNFFILVAAFVVSLTMLLTACKKDENNKNGNTENPEGGNYNNQEYPSTANVIRKAVADIDGNIYDAVRIGDQVWMAENLRTTKYADGTAIEEGTYTSYDTPLRYTSSTDVTVYGYLYNWPAVMHGSNSSTDNPSGVQGICPNGWHVPSDAEWTQLTNYVSSQSQYVCGEVNSYIAKALAYTTGWSSSYNTCAVGNDPSANNATGFSAFPAGYYDGYCDCFFDGASFWSATENNDNYAYIRYLRYYHADVYRGNDGFKDDELSVRCVRD